MRPATLFLDTNILLDSPTLEACLLPTRNATLVVLPEVMRELRGLARSPTRGQAGAAMQAVANLESLARRRGSAAGIPLSRSNTLLRIVPGTREGPINTDAELVVRAKAEQARRRGVLVAVVTRDAGVAERARSEGVKSILIHGSITPKELERRVAEHDSLLDIE